MLSFISQLLTLSANFRSPSLAHPFRVYYLEWKEQEEREYLGQGAPSPILAYPEIQPCWGARRLSVFWVFSPISNLFSEQPMTYLHELIGNTPMVELTKFDTGPCRLFAKLESYNPGGSIKDRIAKSMIERAEAQGVIKPGDTLVEATAGNTGIGLALVAMLKGYKLLLVIPDKMSREKIRHLQALGAEIVITRSDVPKGHPQYYQDLAHSLATERPNSWYVDQFGNPANPYAHETGTGPEIWSQLSGNVGAVVCGVGSSGTITGLSRFFAKVSPATELVVADPVGSIIAHYVNTGEVLTESGSWVVEGIGEDFIPAIADLSRVRKAYSITDAESCLTARELLSREGILAGSSSGTLLAAALRYCREATEARNVVTFVCDSGFRYLSKMFDDVWLKEQGFSRSDRRGDLSDLLPRLYSEGGVVTVTPSDSLLTAYSRMKTYEISQIPVLEGPNLVGIIDELDLLLAVRRDRKLFARAVREVMSDQVKTLSPKASIDEVIAMFQQGLVPLIAEEGKFLGAITKIDVVSALRLE